MSAITISDLLHLNVPERLQLVADLWDSIAAEVTGNPDVLPVASVRYELRRRSAAYRANPHEAIPLDEALDDPDE